LVFIPPPDLPPGGKEQKTKLFPLGGNGKGVIYNTIEVIEY